jgi:nucleolar protein 14
MTQEVPFYAATVARARLQRMHERLSALLAGREVPSLKPLKEQKKKGQGQRGPVEERQACKYESAWPGPRSLLQLKLMTTLFPSSDRRHPVTTPTLLLTARALSQCTASDIGEAVRGLVLSSLALHMVKAAARHCPEVLIFLTDFLLSYCKSEAEGGVSRAEPKGVMKEDKIHIPPTLARKVHPAKDPCVRRVASGLMSPASKGKALAKVNPAMVRP